MPRLLRCFVTFSGQPRITCTRKSSSNTKEHLLLVAGLADLDGPDRVTIADKAREAKAGAACLKTSKSLGAGSGTRDILRQKAEVGAEEVEEVGVLLVEVKVADKADKAVLAVVRAVVKAVVKVDTAVVEVVWAAVVAEAEVAAPAR